MTAPPSPPPTRTARRAASHRGRRLGGRALFLLVSLVTLYLLLPSLLELFSSGPALFELEPLWVAVALAFEALSFAAVWELQRIALGTESRIPVSLSQLAGNAVGRIIPGGAAAAGALQVRMLARAGVAAGRSVSALAAVTALLFGTVFGLPLLSLPAVAAGTPVDPGLAQAAYLGGAVFVLIVAAGIVVFVWDRPLVVVGELAAAIAEATLSRRRPLAADLPTRLLRERDLIRATFGRRWRAAIAASAGRWIFDYLALLACLGAVGARPEPALVLLAYVGASVLGMVPLTPGGLGFVEAGLTGMLVLAGVDATGAATATLAYRLVSFWFPIPVGGLAYLAFRRRYMRVEPLGQ